MKNTGTGFTNGEIKLFWIQQEHQELKHGFSLKPSMTGLRNATISPQTHHKAHLVT